MQEFTIYYVVKDYKALKTVTRDIEKGNKLYQSVSIKKFSHVDLNTPKLIKFTTVMVRPNSRVSHVKNPSKIN